MPKKSRKFAWGKRVGTSALGDMSLSSFFLSDSSVRVQLSLSHSYTVTDCLVNFFALQGKSWVDGEVLVWSICSFVFLVVAGSVTSISVNNLQEETWCSAPVAVIFVLLFFFIQIRSIGLPSWCSCRDQSCCLVGITHDITFKLPYD